MLGPPLPYTVFQNLVVTYIILNLNYAGMFIENIFYCLYSVHKVTATATATATATTTTTTNNNNNNYYYYYYYYYYNNYYYYYIKIKPIRYYNCI